MKIDVLGTQYEIVEVDEVYGENVDGRCDRSIKRIEVVKDWKKEPDNLSDMSVFKRHILRHEIIHAFLAESGLVAESGWTEEQVDWVAIQFPRLIGAFSKADCLER